MMMKICIKSNSIHHTHFRHYIPVCVIDMTHLRDEIIPFMDGMTHLAV
jgi:hypothetical protein